MSYPGQPSPTAGSGPHGQPGAYPGQGPGTQQQPPQGSYSHFMMGSGGPQGPGGSYGGYPGGPGSSPYSGNAEFNQLSAGILTVTIFTHLLFDMKTSEIVTKMLR